MKPNEKRLLELASTISDGLGVDHRNLESAEQREPDAAVVSELPNLPAPEGSTETAGRRNRAEPGCSKAVLKRSPVRRQAQPSEHAQNLDQRSDLFSFGVVLYEILTGVNPFLRNQREATKHASDDRPLHALGFGTDGLSFDTIDKNTPLPKPAGPSGTKRVVLFFDLASDDPPDLRQKSFLDVILALGDYLRNHRRIRLTSATIIVS